MKEIQRIKKGLQMVNYKIRMEKFRRIKGKINKDNRTRKINQGKLKVKKRRERKMRRR